MGKGNSRAFTAMAAAMTAMMGQFSGIQLDQFKHQCGRKLKMIANGGVLPGRYLPHQGSQECARRVRQGVNGARYAHGDQYPKLDEIPVCEGYLFGTSD